MCSMPHLVEARFSGLEQSYDLEGKRQDGAQSGTDASHVYWTASMLAKQPDIVTELRLAIEQSVLMRFPDSIPGILEVRFLRQTKILNLPPAKPHSWLSKIGTAVKELLMLFFYWGKYTYSQRPSTGHMKTVNAIRNFPRQDWS